MTNSGLKRYLLLAVTGLALCVFVVFLSVLPVRTMRNRTSEAKNYVGHYPSSLAIDERDHIFFGSSCARFGRFGGMMGFDGLLGNRLIDCTLHRPIKLGAVGFQSFSSKIDRIGTGLGRDNHLLQLPVINYKSHETNDGNAYLTPERGTMNPVDLIRQCFGGFWLLLGIGFACIAHYAILFGDRKNWSTNQRSFVGGAGWVVASYLIWHGASLLLNV